jgi:HSP20 family molecular chaperone IbpA
MSKEKEPKRRSRFNLYLIIFILLCISTFEGYIIYKGKRYVEKFSGEESFVRFLGEEYRKDKKTTGKVFEDTEKMLDKLFDDAATKPASEKKPEGEEPSFKDKFDNWYQKRFGGSGIGHKTETTGGRVIVTVRIPGLRKESTDIVIEDEMIRLSGQLYETIIERDESGEMTKKGKKTKSFYHTIPVPPGADPDNSKVEFDAGKDHIKIIFKEKA